MSDTTTPTNAQRPGSPLPPPPPAPPAAAKGTVSVDSPYYVVTTPAAEITLGQDRRAEFVVSITNVTGRPLRTSLRLEAATPADAAWFTIVGGAEREFALGETESFTVQVQVPANVPAGTYSVRCDSIAEDAPQEVFTTGPAVSIVVPPVAQKRTFPKWILAVIAGVVLVAVIVTVVVVRSGGDKVPNVTGVAGTQAVLALNNAGFKTDPAAASVNPCDAPVATQDPGAGDKADGGSTVTLTFGACAAVRNVPNLVGRPASQIAPLVPRLGFAVEVVPVGTAAACNPPVSAQSPPPNTRTNTGSVLLLAIAEEPEGCNVVNQLPPAEGDRTAFFTPAKG